MRSALKTPGPWSRKRDDEGSEAQTPKGYREPGWASGVGFLTQRNAMTCIKQRSFDSSVQQRKRGSSGGGDAVKVFVRVKPVMEDDVKQGRAVEAVSVCEKDEQRGIAIPAIGGKEHWFTEYDGILDNATNQQVFDAIRTGILPSFLQGTNATIMAYGQTGSGKTHTMFGSHQEGSQRGGGSRGGVRTSEDRCKQQAPCVAGTPTPTCRSRPEPPQVQGLLHLVLNYIDGEVRIGTVGGPLYSRLSVAVFEIYNEEIYSLLGDGGVDHRLLGKNASECASHVPKLVSSVEEATALITEALQQRARDSTARNATSSRSHAFVKMRLEQPARPGDEHGTVSTLFLVDLAGSESIVHANSAAQARETIAINKSLNVLERVVNALSTLSTPGTSVPHIPYRDSLLTQVLHEGLSPWKARVALIATVSRFQQDIPVTKSTLMFAQRARNVRTYAQINFASKRPSSTCPEDVAAQLLSLQASNNTLRQHLADLEAINERHARQRQTALMLAELQRQADVHAELHRSAARQQQEAEAALEAERIAHAATRSQLAELQRCSAEQLQSLTAAQEEARGASRAATEQRTKAGELHLEVARLTGELAGKHALVEQVQVQHRAAHEQLVQAREQLTVLKGRLAAAEAGAGRHQELDAQVAELHAELDAARAAASAEATRMQQQVHDLQRQLCAAQEHAARQEQLVHERDLLSQLQSQLAEAAKGSSEQVLALQERERQNSTRVQELEGELSRLRKALQAAEDTAVQLRREAATAQAEAAARWEVNGGLEARLQEAEAKANSRAQELQDLQEQIAVLSEAVQAAESALAERSQELITAREETDLFQAKLSTAEAQLAAANGQLAAAQQELAAQKQQLSSLGVPLSAAQEQLATAEAKQRDTQQQLAAAKQRIADVEDAAKAEAAGLRQQLQALLEARAAHEAETAERLVPLVTECERLRATHALTEEQLTRLQGECERLREESSTASDRASRWEAECAAVRAAAQKAEADAADRVAKLEAQMERDVTPRRDATKQLTDRIRQLEIEKKRLEEAHRGQMELKDKLIHQLELMVSQLQAEAAKARPDTATAQASDQQVASSPISESSAPPAAGAGDNTPTTCNTAARGAAGGGMLLRTTGSAAALARNTRIFTSTTPSSAPKPPARPTTAATDLVTPPHIRKKGGDEAVDMTTPASVSPSLDNSLLDVVREQERVRPFQLNTSTTAVRNRMNY